MLTFLKRLCGPSKKPTNVFVFVGLISLGNVLLYQKPLFTHAVSVSDLPNRLGYIQLASLQVLQLCLLAIMLFWIATISLRAMKLTAIVLAMTNATALYFMNAYKMEIDISMIGNILNTDTGEASGLWDNAILPYLVFFGVLPSLLIWRTPLHRSRWFWRFGAGFAALGVLTGVLFAASHSWLWYDQNATRMGSKILPWSYVVNTGRHYNQKALRERTQILLPAATFDAAPVRKQIVVLVIGESARARNFALYGHDQNTNAFTAGTSLAALPMGQSCATNTIHGTACILTHEGSAASSHTVFEPLPSYLTRSGIETYFRTNNSGPPPLVTSFSQTGKDIAEACADDCPTGTPDAALNWKLGETLAASSAQRIFVTLHPRGSHGPDYSNRYPADFARFTPVCETVKVSECSAQALENAYDNSVLYTDYLLANLIAQLQAIPDIDAVMIYVPDHGESLGEGGYYLHGAPVSVAPSEQRDIPFLVWMSAGFMRDRGLTYDSIMPAQGHPHDWPFHSVMGAFGMRSDIYKPEFDLFRAD